MRHTYINEYQTQYNEYVHQVDILARGCKKLSTRPKVDVECKKEQEYKTAYQAILQAPAWIRRVWGSTPPTANEVKEILRVLEKNKLMGGGDGSVKYGVGSHAWEFTEKVTNTTLCQSAGPVDGANETMCSFRAEATHLVAMISILNILQPYVKRKRPFVALYTDSKSVIEALKNPMIPTTKNALKDHHDIIMQLQHMKRKSIFEIDIIHVKAHQDNNDELTPQEELNIRMDKKASEYYDQKEAIIPLQKAPFFPAQRLCITFQEAPLIASIVTTLQNSEQKGEIEDYFETKFAIHPKMQKQIHWTSIRRTFKTNKKKQSMLTKNHAQTNSYIQKKLPMEHSENPNVSVMQN